MSKLGIMIYLMGRVGLSQAIPNNSYSGIKKQFAYQITLAIMKTNPTIHE